LGSLSDLPREIIKLIFNYVTFSEACQTVSVSKSWFKEITAKTFWIAHTKADSSSSNPFRSIQKFIANSYIRDRCHDCFRQMVRVDDGEGLLIMEEGFLTGIKLNGEVPFNFRKKCRGEYLIIRIIAYYFLVASILRICFSLHGQISDTHARLY
jgi:hypothetical protein